MNKGWKIIIYLFVFLTLATLGSVVYLMEISWWFFFGPLIGVAVIGLIFIIVYLIAKQKDVQSLRREEDVKKKVNVSPEECRKIAENLLKGVHYMEYIVEMIDEGVEELGEPGNLSRIYTMVVKTYFDDLKNTKAVILNMAKPHKKWRILHGEDYNDEFKKRIEEAKQRIPDIPSVRDIIKRKKEFDEFGLPRFEEIVKKHREKQKEELKRDLGPFVREEKPKEEKKAQ